MKSEEDEGFPINISEDAGKALILTIAIMDLGSVYILFSYIQLFSLLAMFSLFLLASISFISLLFLDPFSSGRIGRRMALPAIALSSLILLAYSISYDWGAVSINISSSILIPAIAALVSLIAFPIFSRIIGKRLPRAGFYLAFAIAALIMVFLAFIVMSFFNVTNFYTPTDEVAYNYYSAYLALHLQNPYTASMAPALSQYNIIPIPLINGSYAYYYGYPPLSFIAFLPLAPFWPLSAFALKLLTMLFSSLASLFVYYKSRSNKFMIIPIFALLALSYSYNSVSNTYLAISIFLALAFLAMTKRQIATSGFLLGAAISMHQASWFAVPFFLIYCYNCFGKNAFLKQLAAALSVIVLLSLPFILSPSSYIRGISGPFGNSNIFLGFNAADFALAFFPLPNIVLLLLAVSVFSLSVALYYLYNKSLVSLMALAPAFIFMLTWKSTPSYSLPYLILFTLIILEGHSADLKDRLADRRLILVPIAALILMFAALIIYCHAQYTERPALNVTSMYFYLNSAPGSANNSITKIEVNVKNELSSNQTALFLVFGKNPYGYAWARFPANGILPDKTTSVFISPGIIPIDNMTKLGVIMINKNYVNLTVSNYSYII